LTEQEINALLKKYDRAIWKCVLERYPREWLPFSLEPEDVVQEVRIKLWKLLKNRFDPELGTPDKFLRGYLINTVRGVFTNIKASLTTTGNEVKGKIRNRRSLTTALQKVTIYMDDCAELGEKVDPDFEIDFKTITEKVKNKLNKLGFKIFQLIFIDGHSQTDVAVILNKSDGAISKQMNTYIIPALRKALEELEYI
jgi:RNA polymerase sigma factor (sigma-70 family)